MWIHVLSPLAPPFPFVFASVLSVGPSVRAEVGPLREFPCGYLSLSPPHRVPLMIFSDPRSHNAIFWSVRKVNLSLSVPFVPRITVVVALGPFGSWWGMRVALIPR